MILYHYKKTRKQMSKIFLNMIVMFIVYIFGLLNFEELTGKSITENTVTIGIIGFSVAIIICSLFFLKLRRNPATYEAIITDEEFSIHYPESKKWSFSVKVSEIKRFENRNTSSHAGTGINRTGILLYDGTFHEICYNYGVNIQDMYDAIKKVRPNVSFPSKVNLRVEGPILERDYED